MRRPRETMLGSGAQGRQVQPRQCYNSTVSECRASFEVRGSEPSFEAEAARQLDLECFECTLSALSSDLCLLESLFGARLKKSDPAYDIYAASAPGKRRPVDNGATSLST